MRVPEPKLRFVDGSVVALPEEMPEVKYARSGDASIAYQVTGQGPFDLVFIPPFLTHAELIWTTSFAPALRDLSSFSRLIRFDKRGTGMSDRVTGAPTLETRMDDARAVMDAVGCRRAAFFGSSEGAAMSLLFAATYPERTAALVLRSAYPRAMWAPDYPWGWSEEEYRRELERDLGLFRTRSEAMDALRSRGLRFATDQEAREWLNYYRWSGSPGSVQALAAMNREIDVRQVLPAIRVPTLVVHGSRDTIAPVEVARYVADRIPGARLIEVDAGHLATGQAAAPILNEVRSFLFEVWESGGWEEAEPDRVLATVLFTDIVSSSEAAARLGDRAWREILERHHSLVRRELVRFRGNEVDTAGDGFLASFDGPARAIRCARAITDSVAELGLEVRAGLHTGECELIDGKVAGIAVHTGARVASQARPGEILVSSTVKDLVAGSGLSFEDRGQHELKGIPGEWRLFAVPDV
ncbi:MAG TPA: adenylate/guanylate cyclase domain-containing protein [Gaiellaceae bacterium]|nr:adenylate/guanylate cyclase domain-containing protein [Gaiellaceae bacterium]